MPLREGFRGLGEGKLQLHGLGEAPPEEPARGLVPRGEMLAAHGCRLQVTLGDAEIGREPGETHPGLGEKTLQVEPSHDAFTPRVTDKRAVT